MGTCRLVAAIIAENRTGSLPSGTVAATWFSPSSASMRYEALPDTTCFATVEGVAWQVFLLRVS